MGGECVWQTGTGVRSQSSKAIIREELGQEVRLIWMEGETPRGAVRHRQWNEEPEAGYTEGSKLEAVTGAVTVVKGIYLGKFATVMDAEILGIAGQCTTWWVRTARRRSGGA